MKRIARREVREGMRVRVWLDEEDGVFCEGTVSSVDEHGFHLGLRPGDPDFECFRHFSTGKYADLPVDVMAPRPWRTTE